MPNFPVVGDPTDMSQRVLALPFSALRLSENEVVPVAAGLPAGAVLIASRNLVLAATPCALPLFDCVEHAARRFGRDVMLVRTGLFPETLDPVTVDIALFAAPDIVTIKAMHFCRKATGALWLATDVASPAIEIDRTGLTLYPASPFAQPTERIDSACRAAAEIVRLAKSGRR